MKIYKHPQYSYISIVEIPKTEIAKIDLDLCAQPKQTLKAYYDACEVKPAIISNGGFFNMATGNTIFNYVDDGKVISSISNHKEGMGIINGQLKFGTVGTQPFTDFISGYPVLIKDKKKVPITTAKEIDYNARRTVLAYNNSTVYLIAIEKPGMNFSAMQNLLLQLKVDYAINLDGGGSTKILHNGKSITTDWGDRAVDNILAVYLKATTLYRVQVGAFSLKRNADKFLKGVQALQSNIGINYKSAYIKKVGRYYKVQVGAFSNKENAIRVANELKNKGYDSFITT